MAVEKEEPAYRSSRFDNNYGCMQMVEKIVANKKTCEADSKEDERCQQEEEEQLNADLHRLALGVKSGFDEEPHIVSEQKEELE